MRRFLLVGCGGSGGTTLRLLIDQLRADLRARGISSLPDAWQFVHIDVPVDPDKGPEPLGNIQEMGGHYVSFSSPSNSFLQTSHTVEAQLTSKDRNYVGLSGWAPRNPAAANTIPVTSGAGQYRAVGRMLTLPRLNPLRETLVRAQAKSVAPGAWGEIPAEEQSSEVIIPIIVGSMAGGSGASMFLDVARLLGTLPGVKSQNIGCFLYTADVFAQLDEGKRANVEGNAMGALPEIIAAIARTSEGFDAATYGSLGIPLQQNTPPFARVFPIGSKIGGSGAYFGDGSQESVYRGIARALAGTMLSERASRQYLDFMLGNPNPLTNLNQKFGWRVDPLALPFGSLGFASLSLGRDRYLDYAAQRLAHSASDHLVGGHINPTSSLSGNDQLRQLMDNQWGASLNAMGLPQYGQPVPDWFQTEAFPRQVWEAIAREAAGPAVGMLANAGQAPASQWLSTVTMNLNPMREQCRNQLQRSAYAWAEGWAYQLEEAAKREFLRVVSQFGLPYGRELMSRIHDYADQLIAQLAQAGVEADGADPVALDPTVGQQAQSLGKKPVDMSHPIGQMVQRSLSNSMERTLRLEGARIAAGILRAFSSDVLAGLEKAANDALRLLEVERAHTSSGAGLAQLNSEVYADWPDETDRVPMRFKHAENEVLLTTADDFPQQFHSDVVASANGNTDYGQSLAKIRAEATDGKWQTTGSKEEHEVLRQVSHWRPGALPSRASDGQPTPEAKPNYTLLMSHSDLLARATSRLGAKGDVFAAFAGQSISDYLDDPTVTAIDREQRQKSFVAKMAETMEKAKPVVGIDVNMAQRLHGTDIKFVYSFSDIPIGEQHPVSQAMLQRLRANASLDPTSVENFEDSLVGTVSEAGKVSVFGSYQKVSPLCFTSLLDPIQQRWAKAPLIAQRNLWQWKRTRPLSAAIAMSPDELQRVIAGWYLGRLVGLVRQDKTGKAAVSTPDGWCNFGELLTSEDTQVRTAHDVLAAVLMSHAWAFVRCGGDGDLTPLTPYDALRRLVDQADSNAHSNDVSELAGTTLLRAAFFDKPMELDGAPMPCDGPSPVLTRAEADATQTVGQARAAEARAWVDGLRRMYAEQWGQVDANGNVAEQNVMAYQLNLPLAQVRQMSLMSELAPHALPALNLLQQMIDAASVDTSTGGAGNDVWI